MTYRNYLAPNYTEGGRKRRSIETSIHLAPSTLSLTLEKIKRQERYADEYQVNGKYYPRPTAYGYRFVDMPTRSITLHELRELHYNLGKFLENEKA